MQIETKFNVGDTIVAIGYKEKIVKTTCEACNAKGTITLPDNNNYRCPSCHGKGYHEDYTKEQWRIFDNYPYTKPIGEVDVSVVGQRPSKIQIRYMYKGTGNLIDEELCFATTEEAQAECDKRNAKLQE